MRSIAFILFVGFSFSEGLSQPIYTETLLQLNTIQYRGNPKLVITTTIDPVQDTITYTTVNSISRSGRLLRQTTFQGKHILLRELTYTYDSISNKITELLHKDFKNHLYTTRKQYFYEDNRLNFIICNDADDHPFETINIKNNERGDPVQISRTQQKKWIAEKAAYFYDSNAVVVTRFDHYGNQQATDTLSIDIYKPNLLLKDRLRFNKTGDAIYAKEYGDSYGEVEMEYKYDDRMNWIEGKVFYLTKLADGRMTRKLSSVYRRSISYYQ